MKILLHDLPEEANEALFSGKFDNYLIYGDDNSIHQCIGCMNCWYRTPGVCSFRDNAAGIVKNLAECDELVLISACTFGSVSPHIKTILDRAHPLLLPTLEVREGRVSYRPRSKKRMKIRACFYGPKREDYEETAVHLMKNVAAEWDADSLTVEFYEDPSEIGGEPV